jgi:hypothetical protein
MRARSFRLPKIFCLKSSPGKPTMPQSNRRLGAKHPLFGAKDDGLNIPSFSRVLTAFVIVSVLGIVLQVGTAGGGDDQKADAVPVDAASASLPSGDLAAVKTAIALARTGDLARASDVEESIGDPVARKVAEWAILRSDNKEIDFQRYVAFISDNPNWPNIGLLRRRAEAALWKERLDPQIVRAYFDKDQPLTAQGKFALARALLLEGDRAEAQKLVTTTSPATSKPRFWMFSET